MPKGSNIIPPVSKKLLLSELTKDKMLRKTNYGANEIYVFTHDQCPNLMRELGRLREITFRAAGGGTGKETDIDEFDISDDAPYCQMIVWDPQHKQIVGGYRFILGEYAVKNPNAKLATGHIFNYSDKFVNEYLPYTIELGRSFIQPNYQTLKNFRRGLFALDNLWDGVVALTSEYKHIKYWFGKFTMYKSYNVQARNILLSFLNLYFPDNESLVSPKLPIDFEFEKNKAEFSGNNFSDDYKKLKSELKNLNSKIPPLVNAYMNLSDTMKTFGTADNPEFGDVEETGILLNIADTHESQRSRHLKNYKPLIDISNIYPSSIK
ncbi:MAG: GNAT family N-acetyltransferase [Bacteroidales bacterium]|nr:GNAT family N-acetyltransferase [Bacteroidales bacterium]